MTDKMAEAIGLLVIRDAKGQGWVDDGGEGAKEFLSRKTYECGFNDALGRDRAVAGEDDGALIELLRDKAARLRKFFDDENGLRPDAKMLGEAADRITALSAELAGLKVEVTEALYNRDVYAAQKTAAEAALEVAREALADRDRDYHEK